MQAKAKPALFDEEKSHDTASEAPANLNRGADILNEERGAQQIQGDLQQQLEALVNDADDWAQLSKTEQAVAFSSQLRDLYQSFALPLEADSRTPQESEQTRGGASKEEKLQEALRESFPASDPPANY